MKKIMITLIAVLFAISLVSIYAAPAKKAAAPKAKATVEAPTPVPTPVPTMTIIQKIVTKIKSFMPAKK